MTKKDRCILILYNLPKYYTKNDIKEFIKKYGSFRDI